MNIVELPVKKRDTEIQFEDNYIPNVHAWSLPINDVTVRFKDRTNTYQGNEMPKDGNHIVLVRTDKDNTARPAKVVSKGYRVVQHSEVCDIAEKALRQVLSPHEAVGARCFTSVENDGVVLVRQYILPELKLSVPTALHGRGECGYRVIVINAHGGSSVRVITGAIDAFCTNGMILGEHIDNSRWRHTSGFDLEHVAKQIKRSINRFRDLESFIIRMQGREIGPEVNIEEFLITCGVGKRMAARAAARYYSEAQVRGKNAWALYSALTFDATHRQLTASQRSRESQALLHRQALVNDATQSVEWQRFLEAA